MSFRDSFSLRLDFNGQVIHWKGPAPFFFVTIPKQHTDALRAAGKIVSYGWGVVPVEAVIVGHSFTTSLFPRGDAYLLPLKDAVRRRIDVTAGDEVAVEMVVRAAKRKPRQA